MAQSKSNSEIKIVLEYNFNEKPSIGVTIKIVVTGYYYSSTAPTVLISQEDNFKAEKVGFEFEDCKSIIEMMEGELKFTKNRVGKGSQYTINLLLKPSSEWNNWDDNIVLPFTGHLQSSRREE
jgi:hypothetical protein